MNLQTLTSDVANLPTPLIDMVPVNPSNRFDDIIWVEARKRWSHEDPEGTIRDFAYVRLDDGDGVSRLRLAWRYPDGEVYRLWRELPS